MSDFQTLVEAIIKADIATATVETQKLIDNNSSVQDILDKGLIAPMDEVGTRFSKGQMFVPQMLRSAKAMQECMTLIKPLFKEGNVLMKGSVVIGTVKGDLHDIGKNLVVMMMEGAGFTITDLGVDVTSETFVQKAKETDADIVAMSALLSTTMPGMQETVDALQNIVAMSALLSTTMPGMQETVDALQKAGLRDKIKVMIGGAPVSENYANQIKADSYAPDAGSAVTAAKKLMGIT
jgi:5-methyltetrahydrofolate--homocysteine methyltransferase